MKRITAIFLTVFLSGAMFSACTLSFGEENAAANSETVKKERKPDEKTKNGDKPKIKATDKPNAPAGKNPNKAGSDLKKRVCKKFSECGCQDYEDCLAEIEQLDYDDAVWKCMLKSSCESLCEGNPDACPGVKNDPGTTAPDTPSCSQISCTKNGDCPGGCHGGCIDGYCSLF